MEIGLDIDSVAEEFSSMKKKAKQDFAKLWENV
jgi:hypothetical protein